MRFFETLFVGCVMLGATVSGMGMLFIYIQQRNWPMVALFSIAVSAAATFTLLIFRQFIKDLA